MTRTTPDVDWLSVGAAGRALGLSRTSLLAAEDAGLLTSMRTPGGHRRYHPAELRRYLDAAGAGPMPPPRHPPDRDPDRPRPEGRDPTAPDTAAGDRAVRDRAAGDRAALAMAAVVRAAVRPLVQLLDAQCGGLYLLRDTTPRFCAAFGVPRWLTERLADGEPPREVALALDTGRPRLFDPAAVAFPEPRSTGHGVAVAVPGAQRPSGLLFTVLPTGHVPLPAELRTVDAFARLIGLIVADRSRITDLECRLARIAALSGPSDIP